MCKLQALQPIQVLLCPIVLAVKHFSIACIQRNDLLLDTLQCGNTIIPHSDILFHGVIFFIRDIYRTVAVVCQTPGNLLRVALVRFNLFSRSDWHGTRRENNTVYTFSGELMIQAIPQASCFIPAHKLALSAVLTIDPVEIFQDFSVIRLHLHNRKRPVITYTVAASGEI